MLFASCPVSWQPAFQHCWRSPSSIERGSKLLGVSQPARDVRTAHYYCGIERRGGLVCRRAAKRRSIPVPGSLQSLPPPPGTFDLSDSGDDAEDAGSNIVETGRKTVAQMRAEKAKQQAKEKKLKNLHSKLSGRSIVESGRKTVAQMRAEPAKQQAKEEKLKSLRSKLSGSSSGSSSGKGSGFAKKGAIDRLLSRITNSTKGGSKRAGLRGTSLETAKKESSGRGSPSNAAETKRTSTLATPATSKDSAEPKGKKQEVNAKTSNDSAEPKGKKKEVKAKTSEDLTWLWKEINIILEAPKN